MPESRATLLKSEVNTRRSRRVIARIRVEVRKRMEGQNSAPETSHTVVVNAHGALLELTMKVQPNELLAIKNIVGGDEMDGRVVRVNEEASSQYEVSIEFVEPAPNFWHIDFPPPDWKVLQD
jgi:hypothetical protein